MLLSGVSFGASLEGMKVVHYMEKQRNLVKVSKGTKDGLISGVTLYSLRPAPGTEGREIPVYTGKIKILQVFEQSSLGEIVVERTELSQKMFPDYPGVMAGDSLILAPIELAEVMHIVPVLTLSYFSLFVDPGSAPKTFELSERGKEVLEHSASYVQEKRFHKLLIKGYTDHHGLDEQNKAESLERAEMVRRYLINELNFDPSRVVALGLGEDDPVDESMTPGYEQNNRRVELSVISEEVGSDP